MKSYFKCTVRFTETADNGMDKKSSEEYVIDAMTYTEAEAVINDYVKDYNMRDMEIDIAKYKVEEVIESSFENFYKLTYDELMMDEVSGAEKRKSHSVLIMSDSVMGALDKFNGYTKGWVVDFEVVAVKREKRMICYIPADGEKGEDSK